MSDHNETENQLANKDTDIREAADPQGAPAQGKRAVKCLQVVLIFILIAIGLYGVLIIYPALNGGPVSSLYPSALKSFLPEDSPAFATPTPEPTLTPKPTLSPTPTATPTPTPTAAPTPSPTPVPTLAPEITAIKLPSYDKVSAEDWELILVNKTHPIPDEYEYELESYDESGSFQIDTRIAAALRDMMSDCAAFGYTPQLCSAWRTDDTQSVLFDTSDYKEAHPDEEITSVALPGTSEHEIGIAVDIFSEENHELDESQEDTETQQWFMNHCWEYGFILRYPKGKEEITEIIYEPWHYRYVGRDAAEDIMKSGLCLEEYLENLKKVKTAEAALEQQLSAVGNTTSIGNTTSVSHPDL